MKGKCRYYQEDTPFGDKCEYDLYVDFGKCCVEGNCEDYEEEESNEPIHPRHPDDN